MNSRLFVVITVWLVGCGEPTSSTPDTANQEAVPATLVERESFFDNPTRIQGRVSPDGRWLSWLAPVDGVMNVWVAPSSAPTDAKPITHQTERGVPVHFWSSDSAYVLYNQDQGGNENYHVYAADPKTGDVRDLTPLPEGARAVVEGLSRDRPGVVLVGLNHRQAQLFDLYEVDIASGEQTLIKENPGYVGWVVDNTLQPRLAWRQLPDGSRNLMRLTDQGEALLTTFSAQDVMTSGVFGFDDDNQFAYALDSRDRDKAALVKIQATTGATEILAESDEADVSDLLIDPATRTVIAYATEFTRVSWQGLTESGRKLLDTVRSQIQGDLNFVSATTDGKQFVIAAGDATEPGKYYLFDSQAESTRLMFDSRPQLADAPLNPMHPQTIQSRDGLTLVAYLTLPRSADPDEDGKPDAPLPMVLYVHGGPWARDRYGYSATHQWLSNRGYAVLSVNYRGSTGFGKQFLNAAQREFAGKMHDDLIDAVHWAEEQRIAAPEKTAIMGGSYGGYATLVGLTFTPDEFACGVDIVGPSNLITLIESFPAYWRPSLAGNWFAFVGDPESEADRADMFNRSPIARVADIKKPLLIGQGENDPRVTKAESDQIVAAMEKRNLPVTYLNYPDEGHGFARPQNRLSFYATAEAFLAQCLGGRYQPIGDDFAGSSVQVLHGADYVPGLESVSPPQESGG